MPPKRSAIGRSTKQAKRRREERASETTVGPTFVLMDNNARPHRADIVDDYLKRRDCAYGVSSRFPPPATLIELEIALQEEWRLLNSAVVYHLIESMVRR
ncbi:transposable element Tcb2 transposase [Trichonephila clavipes]|nr:transposable element Tcb2 transposase [Trichonephila clavipes]